MSDSFQLKVFTPAGLVLEDKALWVNLPSEMGEIGILPKHVKFTGLVATGILEYAPTTGAHKKFVVSGGFCSFSDETLVILADAVDLPENVSSVNFTEEKNSLQKIIQTGETMDPEWQTASIRMQRIQAIERLVH